ncbi:MAG: choice-of-anchor I family protein [Aestuariibaculum sp.]
MKRLNHLLASSLLLFASCDNNNDNQVTNPPINTKVNFEYVSTIKVGGATSAEITAFDATTNRLFVVNVEIGGISVYDISNIKETKPVSILNLNNFGTPNSVSVNNGILAVAVEANVKQNNGKVALYNTSNLSLIKTYTVGALPDMVTFTNNGKYILSANEGEPNPDYTVDPNGSVSIIDIEKETVTTLDFTSFNSQQATLQEKGFRVFGPNATLAQDVEPEYIAVSNNSKYAWVSLQENNGMAKINIETKTIEAIYPLGFKNFNIEDNSIDASDKDAVSKLKTWPVYGMYQPDAVVSATIDGITYIFSANEGDARDYDTFSEEERCKKLDLDATAFPNAKVLQENEQLGRLKLTTTLGDTDKDGDYDELYNYGARSFSVWSDNGHLLYDSGNDIALKILESTPHKFNWDWEDNQADKRSDDKGAEPEAVEILNIGNERYILFVGLERNSQIMVYDVTQPTAPVFLDILEHECDLAPEGVLSITAKDSPTGNALLVVANEDSGTVSFYENKK